MANISMAALPDAGYVVQHAEGKRQNETTDAPDHSYHAADGPHMHRVVHRNVFVDGRLTERHEKTEDKGEHHEHGQAHGQGEMDIPSMPCTT